MNKKLIVILIFLLGTGTLLFFIARKDEKKEFYLTSNAPATSAKEENKNQTGYTGTYGMLATSANSTTIGDIDFLVKFLTNYPNVTSEETKEYQATIDSLHLKIEDFSKISPLDLNGWWQSTYYLLTSVINNQEKLTTNIDLTKLQADPTYKKDLIKQMERNKNYLAYNSDVITKFVTAKYPSMYHKYSDESVVGSKFEGLPEFVLPPDYPYFGIPLDIDRDNKFEMVFYTKKAMNRVPHTAYLVKDDVIIYQSKEGASVLLMELEDPTEKGFYLTEDDMDINTDNRDRIFTKYTYENGVISKVGEEIRKR